MVFIEKEGLPSSVVERIIGIRKSDAWKGIDRKDVEAIRNVFNNEFPKDEVKEVLIHEQHGLCAYCMKRIKNDSHSRIEHLMPLSKDKEKSIEYNNMLGVCDGGERVVGQNGRILCCDAHKKDVEISLNPLNKIQMDKIAYTKEGVVYTNPYDKDMEFDINVTLGLNGVRKPDGSVRDTSTEILKGRRDAYARAKKMLHKLDVNGKCTSANLQRLIHDLEEKEEREEYVGVKLYYLKKKLKSLVKQGV